MNTFNKNDNPKQVNNLSSNHATMDNLKGPVGQAYKPENLNKINSDTFKNSSKIYNVNTLNDKSSITNLNSQDMTQKGITDSNGVAEIHVVKQAHPIMPKEHTEDVDTSFTKSHTEIDKAFKDNQVETPNQIKTSFNEFDVSNETKIPAFTTPKPPVKKSKKTLIMKIVFIGIALEVLFLIGLSLYKYLTRNTSLECSNNIYNDFYKANISVTKDYSFVSDVVDTLVETTVYTFDNVTVYNDFKKTYAMEPYSDYDGRVVITSINDNNKTYTETITYDYSKLREDKNNSGTANQIVIDVKDDDQINLADYNKEDMSYLYKDDYVCKK